MKSKYTKHDIPRFRIRTGGDDGVVRRHGDYITKVKARDIMNILITPARKYHQMTRYVECMHNMHGHGQKHGAQTLAWPANGTLRKVGIAGLSGVHRHRRGVRLAREAHPGARRDRRRRVLVEEELRLFVEHIRV